MAWPTKTDFVDGDVLTAAQVNNIGTNLNIFNPTAATNGQILTANGAGSASFVTPPAAGGLTLISSTSLTTDPTTISSIPGTYKHLMFVWRSASGNANNQIFLQVNSVADTSHYYLHASYSTTWTGGRNFIPISYTGASPRNGSQVVGWFYDYANTTSFKTMTWQQADDFISGTNSWYLGYGNILTTQAITSIKLDGSGMTTLAGTFLLYGVN